MSLTNPYSWMHRPINLPQTQNQEELVSEMARTTSDPWIAEVDKYVDSSKFGGKPFRLRREISWALQKPSVMGNDLPASPEEVTKDQVVKAAKHVISRVRMPDVELRFKDDAPRPDEMEVQQKGGDNRRVEFREIPSHDTLQSKYGKIPFKFFDAERYMITNDTAYKYMWQSDRYRGWIFLKYKLGDKVTLKDVSKDNLLQLTILRNDGSVVEDIIFSLDDIGELEDDVEMEEDLAHQKQQQMQFSTGFNKRSQDEESPMQFAGESNSRSAAIKEQQLMLEAYRKRVKHAYLLENKFL